jgi:hypothetical protein
MTKHRRPASGESREKASSPVAHKTGQSPERDELTDSALGKVVGGMRDDPCAGGQYRNR